MNPSTLLLPPYTLLLKKVVKQYVEIDILNYFTKPILFGS